MDDSLTTFEDLWPRLLFIEKLICKCEKSGQSFLEKIIKFIKKLKMIIP